MYVTKERLRELVKDCQATGRMSSELLEAFGRIAHGLYSYMGKPGLVDEDDYKQEAYLRLLARFHLIRPEGNLFCYLTQCCKLTLWDMTQAKRREKHNLKTLFDRVHGQAYN